MSAHLPARSRFGRTSTSSGHQTQPSSLLKSPSTPLDVYRLQHSIERQPSTSSNGVATSKGSPRPSVFVEHESPNSFASYRRNAGFGSPGAHAIRSSNVGTLAGKGRASSGHPGSETPGGQLPGKKRFVRRKTWTQRLREAPSLWYDQLVFSENLDWSNPAIGYPLGGFLHAISMLTLFIHPDGVLHYGAGSGRSARSPSLFADQSGLGARRKSQQQSAWRFTANVIVLAVIVAVLSSAYNLLTSRRRYHLWLKPVDEQLSSENASLVGLPSEADVAQRKPWQQVALDAGHRAVFGALHAISWLAKRLLYRIRVMRYIGVVVRFFFPASSGRRPNERRRSASGPQMHALDVWQAPEVPLRIFTVYSPLHLLFYLYHLRKATAELGHAAKISHLLIGMLLMTILSAQTYALVYLYTGLIRDKALIAGEVMNEYNQKFVMPRAMPVCRDASTMTSQSEMVTAEDMQDNSHNAAVENQSRQGNIKRKTKSRATATQ